jgi:acyl transferase domain-containing protein/thioesterase domain-containing protein/aryl carrier-like protein
MSNEAKLRRYLEKVTVDLRQANRRVGDLERRAREPIAIVGMSCRYPGGLASPGDLWRLLAEGRDAISPFPTDRGWDLEALHDPDPDRIGTCYAREGGFIDDVAGFDADFFSISPREAEGVDPQERLMLEASWEALEASGIDPTSLRGREVGVFAGVMLQDYGSVEAGVAPGMTTSVVSGRVAYSLGLQGPAVTVDTACSSSLVAMHLAAQALRGQECELALAGGVTVMAAPHALTYFSHQRGLAPDGRCKPFAEAADGTVFSEGVGLVVLERLSDAQANGHAVLATIRGSAINQDGASNGLTAPNGPSQERVIRHALANAGLSSRDVDVVEAHGTGTALGDPIEAGALIATYGREREKPLWLGSVKSNLGHTQAAAGVAGAIKMVLAMQEGALPPTLHVDEPSSKVDWEAGEIELLREPMAWEKGEEPRRAAISSFGISGTNAHLILEEAPQAVRREPDGSTDQNGEAGQEPPVLSLPPPLVLSAKSQRALTQAAADLASHLRENPELEPADVAYSVATTRASFAERAAIFGTDRESLLAGLGAVCAGGVDASVVRGTAAVGKVAQVFSGLGGQWQGMALELFDASPAFASHMAACEEALAPHWDWSVSEVLRDSSGDPLQQLDVVQPVLFAVMVSLAKLWRECGVKPSVVVGHSFGEVAAAHVAGGLSLQDAALLVAARGRLIAKLLGRGALASISLSPDELEARLSEWEGGIEIAVLNGPGSTIVSGETEPLDELLERCEAEGVRARRLPASIASHSHHVEVLRDELLEVLAPISPQSGEIPFHSTVTGEVLDTAELTPEYWYRNLRQTVLLEPVVRDLLAAGTRTLIEVGPHPVLSVGLQETVEAAAEDPGSVSVIPTLRRGEGGPERFALSLAQAHVAGAPLDWEALFDGTSPKRVPLPTYPFQRKRYWLSSAANGSDPSAIGQSDPSHPLLGAKVEDPEGGFALTGRISLPTHPWLADHAVSGTVLLPGTAFLELALAGAREAGAGEVAELTLQAPLLLPERGSIALRVAVSEPDPEGAHEIAIHSRPQGEEEAQWTLHAQGRLTDRAPEPPAPLTQWPPEGAEPIETADLYEELAQIGFEYGPAFQGLQAAWRDGEDLYAEVSLAAEQAGEAERYAVHPALLDAALQGLALLRADAGRKPMLPAKFTGASLWGEGERELRVALTEGEHETRFHVADPRGSALATGSVGWKELDASLTKARPGRGLLATEWKSVSLGNPSAVDEDGPGPSTWQLEVKNEGPEAVLEATAAALRALQDHLDEEAASSSRLTVLTRGALTTGRDEAPDPAAAAVWGLVRSAQAEHPGRFSVVDVDGEEASLQALPAAVALGGDEPQLALRGGEALAPRLGRIATKPNGEETPSAPIDPDRTVLITGGTGAVGSLVARHLVEAYGARHLLLVNRTGEEAPGVPELRAELVSQGAQVHIVSCDVSERRAVEDLLASIPDAHPIGAVIHAAASLEDGAISSLGPERTKGPIASRFAGAWHLHELTRGAGLSTFLLLPSAAGTLGIPGRGNDAAACAALDALAALRRGEGLPALTIAVGPWNRTGEPREPEAAARIRRLGLAEMPKERLLGQLDASLAGSMSQLLALELDRQALRSQAREGLLPPILDGLVRRPARRAPSTGTLASRLASLPAAERETLVLELVRERVASVLGHASAAEVAPDRAFLDMGLDSLGAVELRNRLTADSGLHLQTTVVFDHPSVAALAQHLLDRALGEAAPASPRLALDAAAEEPIAIVGMACRYPGGVSSPEDLWRLVASGTDAIAGFPTDRGWDLERLYDPDPDNAGTSYVREGGFLSDLADFDPAFFGISPREAEAIDPQQRQLLEVCWEALENAGVPPDQLRGSQTGLFVGAAGSDFGMLLGSDGSLLTGASSSVVAGRTAYTFGFEGPAMTVDTACSSSLVALHLAIQALRSGECSLAVSGGVAAICTPAGFVDLNPYRGLAPDARCKAFAEAADGTGFSEGVGLVLLERLSEAERNGRRVLATIRGSALNQDGASNGLTAPNGRAQERVIRQALANAGLAPGEVDAVEAHGTGTTLGDPIEANAVLATYGQEREEPLRLGSIKSNIGHTAAAAGIAGVIKMVLAMREGVMPQTLHVDRPSSNVDWSAGRVELLREPQAWEAPGRPRRAGISSFGMSGTNAHLILEEAPTEPSRPAVEQAAVAPWSSPVAIPLSAKSEGALIDGAARLRSHLEAKLELDPRDVAYSLATGRTAFERRAVVLAGDRAEALDALAALMGGAEHPALVHGSARGERRPVFLFPGQGAHWPGMALDLLDRSPAFSAKLGEAREALEPHLDWSFDEVLRGGAEAMPAERPDVVQPMVFAVMVSLAALWRAAGVEPAAVVGQSQGEIAAAHVAGGLSIEDAARAVALRSKVLLGLVGQGKMISVRLGTAELAKRLDAFAGAVEVAAVTGPSSTVLAGDVEELDELMSRCEAEGVRARDIPGAVGASHSSYVEPLREELLRALAPISPRSGEVPFYSTVTGEPLDTGELNAEYWYRNVRQSVRLEPVLRSLLVSQGQRGFIEVSPHPVLGLGLRETIDDALEAPANVATICTLRRDEGGPERFARSLAEAHAAGVEVDWGVHFAKSGARRVELPTYPFQRRRYWPQAASEEAGNLGAAGLADAGHPLLGAAVEDPDDGGLILTGRLSAESTPWLAEHVLGGSAMVPSAILAELALEAGARVGAEDLAELEAQAPLGLAEGEAVALRVSVGSSREDGSRSVSIHSRPADGAGSTEGSAWTRHARGLLARRASREVVEPALDPASWPPEGAEVVDVEELYDRLRDAGLEIGSAFRAVRRAWRRAGEVFAELSLSEEQSVEAEPFRLHPALLGAVQPLALAAEPADPTSDHTLALPALWRGLRLLGRAGDTLRLRLVADGEGVALAASGPEGEPVFAVDSVVSRALTPASANAARLRRSLHRVGWVEARSASLAETGRKLAVLGGDDLDLSAAERYPDLDSLLAALEGEEAAPQAVLVDARNPAGDLPAAAHAAARGGLELARAWVGSEALRGSRLVFLTAGAFAPLGEESPNLAAASLRGLVHAAGSEHLGRFGLVDVDGADASWRSLPAALALAEEPQLAIREGTVLAPRLAPAEIGGANATAAVDPEGTVLITGGTTGIGAAVARHLVAAHGARHLLLVSRRGRDAEGAAELETELTALGARPVIAACDVADRDQLRELIASIPAERPLRVVIHSAAVLDNGVLESLDAERLERVMRPKVDAAWHLHELTKDLDLSAFMLFSSVAGQIGSSAQANYAAANVFLDELAHYRRARGLPAISVAWGGWLQESALFEDLSAADKGRLERMGLDAVSPEEGLELFDAACESSEPLLIPVGLRQSALRRQAKSGMLPALLRGMVSGAVSDAGATSLRSQLAAASPDERESLALAFVRAHVALVLGYASPEEVEPDRNLQEMGFDSLGAVELRNRLSATSGVQVPVMAITDNPSAAGIANYLLTHLASPPSEAGAGSNGRTSAFIELLEAAREQDAVEEFVELIERASTFRRSFDVPPGPDDLPRPVRLAEGAPDGPTMVLLSSAGPMSGPHEYVQLAKRIPGEVTVLALALPGFVEGERLPRSVQALVEAEAKALLASEPGSPLVVAGHSSGGWVAHALVSHLETREIEPACLVLLDTYLPGSDLMVKMTPAVVAGVYDAAREGAGVDDVRLTATGAYRRIFAGWAPAEISTPTALVRASGSAWKGAPPVEDWRPSWDLPHTQIDVPGDHFTMLTEHASNTAEAMVSFLHDIPESSIHTSVLK